MFPYRFQWYASQKTTLSSLMLSLSIWFSPFLAPSEIFKCSFSIWVISLSSICRQQAGAKFIDCFAYDKWFYCQIFKIFCLPFTFRVVKGARTFFKTVCKFAKKVRLCCLLSLDLLSTFHEQMIYDKFITCSFATKEKKYARFYLAYT